MGRKAAPCQEDQSLFSTLDSGTATFDICGSVLWLLIADNKVCWLNALIFQRSHLRSHLQSFPWLFYYFQANLQELKERMGSGTKKMLYPKIISDLLGEFPEEYFY